MLKTLRCTASHILRSIFQPPASSLIYFPKSGFANMGAFRNSLKYYVEGLTSESEEEDMVMDGHSASLDNAEKKRKGIHICNPNCSIVAEIRFYSS